MMIAVPATGPGLDARVETRFGRCACFLLVDPRTLDFELLENTAALMVTGAGPAAADLVASAGASVVLASGLGANAVHVLRSTGVEVFRVSTGTVRQAVKSYVTEALPRWSLSEPSDPLPRLQARARALRDQLEETQRQIRELEQGTGELPSQGMTTSSSSRTSE